MWSRNSTVRWYEVAYFSKTALKCACATQRQVTGFWDLITRCTSFLKADSHEFRGAGPTVAWAKPSIQAISWNGPGPATPRNARLTHLFS